MLGVTRVPSGARDRVPAHLVTQALARVVKKADRTWGCPAAGLEPRLQGGRLGRVLATRQQAASPEVTAESGFWPRGSGGNT